MNHTKEEKQKQDDSAVAALSVYQELKRRLLVQASRAMAVYNQWRVAVKIGATEGLEELEDKAVREYWELEKIEAAIAPYLEIGYPEPIYDRPNPEEFIATEMEDPWAKWRSDANVEKANNQSGIVPGFDR